MTSLFLTLADISVAAGWLIAAVCLMRLLLKRAPKAITMVMWGVVALRLVLPFSVESAVSLVPSTTAVSELLPTRATALLDVTTTAVSTAATTVTTAESAHRETTLPSRETRPTETKVPAAVVTTAPPAQTTATAPTDAAALVTTAAPTKGSTKSEPFPWEESLTIVWLGGIVVMAAYGLWSTYRLKKRVRPSLRVRDNVFICDDVDSPFILGLLRPRVYLPSHLTEEQSDYVVAHEHAHIRRGDHVVKLFAFVLLSVYWFHPLVWVAYFLLCRDIELACDERVIRPMDSVERAKYSSVLLQCSISRTAVACPLAFGEIGVKARIRSVFHYKKPALWIVLAAVLAVAAVTVCFFTCPTKHDPTPPVNAPVSSTTTTAPTTSAVPPTEDTSTVDNLTLTMDIKDHTLDQTISGTIKVDLSEQLMTMMIDVGYEVMWTAADGATVYGYTQSRYDAAMSQSFYEENSVYVKGFWEDVAAAEAESMEEILADDSLIEVLTGLGYVEAQELIDGMAKLTEKSQDEAWLQEHFGYTKTVGEDGAVTYTAAFCIGDAVTILNELFADSEAIYEEELPQEMFLYDCELEVTMKGKTLEYATVLISFDGQPQSELTAHTSHIGTTTVDVDQVVTMITTANDGHLVCQECGATTLAGKGYCDSCYTERFCINDGNPVYRDGYCEECFVPCVICGDYGWMYTDEHEEERYCATCYYDRYCYNDDGNPVYRDGYCEDCFTECVICSRFAQYHDGDGNAYCDVCYYDRFCYNDDGNRVYRDGYCEECFVPCVTCGKYYGDPWYDGQCEDCYYSNEPQSGVLVVNGVTQSAQIGIYDEYIDVPFLSIVKALGAEVTWIDDQTIAIEYYETSYELHMDDFSLWKDGVDTNALLTPPGGKSYYYSFEYAEAWMDHRSAQRALAEFSASLKWDKATSTITVLSEE